MSLNGLDDAPVSDAYQSALAEAGGWFLLKYASRDAIEIFNFGAGGLSEARAALLEYDEKSPLYGFLLFRRRKVLLKYVPEGTSRLLQARVTVHFTEIEEKFTPHDSVFSFSTPQELSDHALSAANSLHTAAPSTSASSTSSKKKLDGINEDAEDSQGTSAKGEGAALERTETVASTTKVEAAPDTASIRSRPLSPTGYEERRPGTPGTSGGDASSVIASPRGYAQSVRSFKSLNHFDQHYDDPNRRSSSQTARADIDFSYLYKPKVKLGPRPTQEPLSHAAESKSAKLPASLKAAVRSKGSSSRPKSRDSSTVPSTGLRPPPPVPTISEMPTNTPARPTSSTGAKSIASSVKSPGITPEKQRLMRAVELRKKQKAAQLARQKPNKKHGDAVATADAVEKVKSAEETAPEAAPVEEDDVASHRETTSSTDSGSTLKPDEAPETPDHTKADSGVQLMISGAGDEEDARPPTPVASSPISVQESSNPSSTRPSSISDGGDRKEGLDSDEQAEIASPLDGAAETSLGLPSAAEPAPARASGAEHPNWDVSSSPDRGETGEHQTAAAKGPELSEDFTTALPSSSSLPERRSTTKSKRRVPVDPIRVEPDAESSDDDFDYLSDDSLMEELQSATVEEAKPMSVSKSPIMSIFPRRKSQASTLSTKSAEHRVNSNPLSMYRTVTPTRLSPSPEGQLGVSQQLGVGQRSFSASYATEAQRDASLLKKSNVSSGISQRIKALAEKSSKDGTPVTLPKVGYTPERGAISIAQRSNSFRASHSAQDKQLKRLSKSSFISVPPLERPMSKGENSNESIQAVYNKDANNKTESVTVTARIVRSPQTPGQDVEDSPLDLQPSPITIDHNKADEAAAPPSIVIPTAVEESTKSPTSGDASPAQQSNAHLESPAQPLPRSSSESSWRSFGRRRSEATSPPPMPRSQSITSLDSTVTEEGDEKKKGNRASRLLKRMSNSLTTSKKSLNQMMSSAVQEEAPQPIEEKKESQPGVEIGDLNVQFPDTLLWKRRWVEIDVQGNIVLTLSKANDASKGITKRYHLSEFSAPFAPDQEREEMPNSVMLDFHDGRTLQCACESAPGQTRVLGLLKEAHSSWSQ
ncbi:gpi-anchored cell surface glycoprotein [Diplodia corticola]|uniref:Gpi-anchored cell surface glycoprotein n=1 Tax=Diplodia corticola TaxID=236234 RepID=A0A1J9RPB0_9PEZI|nr:gpi-anchored cell surface glycoprotein [Diplodia corticola]OJD29756.1 gpi-anchored cell surface glycoprotein [Diplodia corticola]